MRVRLLSGAAAVIAAASCTGAVHAQTIQLRVDAGHEAAVQRTVLKGVSGDAKAMTLELTPGDDADTQEVRGYRGGWGGYRGGWGGYRGGWGGYRGWGWGGYRGWGWGGYRGWGWGGYRGWGWYRPWYGYGWYRPWGGWSYPYYYSYYSYPSYYYVYPDYYYYYPTASLSYYYPTGGAVGNTGDVLSQPRVLTPNMPGPGSNGTFPYDGGPTNPVPMPRSNPAPAAPAPVRKPAATVPLDGTLVSAPAARPVEKFTYSAYGEKRTATVVKPVPKDQVAEKNGR